MLIIEEMNELNREYFYLIMITENGHDKIFIKEVCITLKKAKLSDKSIKYILYDSQMKPIEGVYRYLNKYKLSDSKNTIRKIGRALCLYFTFKELRSIKDMFFTEELGKEFVDFLLGKSKEGVAVSYNLKTGRNPKSVNDYLGFIRNYYEYLGVTDSVFHKKKSLYRSRVRGKLSAKKTNGMDEAFVIKANTPNLIKKVSRHITVNKMKEILEYIQEEKELREEVTVRLMYEAGLRIGEVLGLTLEDLCFEQRDLEKLNQNNIVYIELRNRISDRFEYQNAKSCMKVDDYSDYVSDAYRQEDFGYQRIPISVQLARMLLEYIDSSTKKLSQITRKNYFVDAKADRVVMNDSYLSDDNYYVFLNKNGGSLSGDGWNKNLKGIFESCDIYIDENIKEFGLNHAFRHGFAMFLKEVVGLEIDEISLYMRHKNVNTTKIYLQKKESEKRRVLEEVIQMRFKMF